MLQDKDVIVTTLIDCYGIKDKFQFPRWAEAHNIVDKVLRMEILEKGILESVERDLNHRLIPYIQLHEFEGLLFNDMIVFENVISGEDFIDKAELKLIIDQYPNPELINDSPENAPSNRLKRLIKGYNKIVYGSIIAESIGLSRIRIKSPRFNEWITKLENI